MPVTKRFEVNRYLEDFEELDEQFPLFSAKVEAEEAFIKKEVFLPEKTFWRKWSMVLKSKFSK